MPFLTKVDMEYMVGLTQCFSTGVPRNPRVPWSTSKGSARFDKFFCFIGMYIGEMAHCSFIMPYKAIVRCKEIVKSIRLRQWCVCSPKFILGVPQHFFLWSRGSANGFVYQKGSAYWKRLRNTGLTSHNLFHWGLRMRGNHFVKGRMTNFTFLNFTHLDQTFFKFRIVKH